MTALGHIRVLDLTRILAGPWATQTLADLGAHVIKVERPGHGDDTRAWGPPYIKDENGALTQESAYFQTVNRNKESLALDITSSEGQEILKKLMSKVDVVVENFKVGGLSKYGLDYDSLKQLKPDLIYCSITGFGQTGPYAHRAGYDVIIQAMGGLMSITGEPDDHPGGGPMKTGVALADVMTGLYSTIGILSALTHRDRTGEGQHIDMALLDVTVATLANQAMNYLATEEAPKRMGNAHPSLVPYQSFPTADGHMIMGAGNDKQFRDFCKEVGCSELSDDPRFTNNQARVANREILIPIISEIIATRTTNEWVETLEHLHVPCGPINNLDQVFDDPQVKARGLKIDLPHSTAGTVPSVAMPIRLSKTPAEYRTAPQLLGESTRSVLTELCDINEETLRALEKSGVIQLGDKK
ncbi:MAG: CoA transferase [Rhodospirillales bacterium]|nr:CoA transferase [Rhodospirillales bacterium]